MSCRLILEENKSGTLGERTPIINICATPNQSNRKAGLMTPVAMHFAAPRVNGSNSTHDNSKNERQGESPKC